MHGAPENAFARPYHVVLGMIDHGLSRCPLLLAMPEAANLPLIHSHMLQKKHALRQGGRLGPGFIVLASDALSFLQRD